MADAELVLEYLDPPDDVEIIGIVVNAKGAERAVKTEAVTTLGFPYSISPEFLKRNQNQTPEESVDELEAVGTLAYKAGLGCGRLCLDGLRKPLRRGPGTSTKWLRRVIFLVDCGVRHISLADTVGRATPKQVADLFRDVSAVHDAVEIGLHLHATLRIRHWVLLRLRMARVVRRFDAAIGGLGGCPFAQDALVGNLPTEVLIRRCSQN